MRIEQLHYLLEISKTHSISLAAENLFLTQPALSNGIKKLEEELGIALFTRSKNGVFLTPPGEDILSAATSILQQAQNIQQIVDSHKVKEPCAISGSLKLQVVPPINFLALPAVMPLFNQQYPKVVLHVMENNPEEIIKCLAKPDYDLYIFSTLDNQFEKTIPRIISDHPELVVNYLSAQRIYASVSTLSPLAQQTSISLKELSKQPLGTLTYTQNDYDFLSRILKDFDTHIVFRTNNIHILTEQISKGHCISVTAAMTIHDSNIKLIPISNAMKLQFYYAYYGDNKQIELIIAFLQLLKLKF